MSTYATAPVVDGPTGEHTTITPGQAQSPPPWVTEGARQLGRTAAYLGLSALVPGICYVWAASAGAPLHLRVPLLALLIIVAIAAVGAWIGAYAARSRAQVQWALHLETQQAIAEARREVRTLATAVAQCAGELHGMPEMLRTEVERQGTVHLAIAEEIRTAFGQRVAAVEQRVGELESAGRSVTGDVESESDYLKGYADGLAGRMTGEAQVVQLPGSNGQQRQTGG